MRKKLLIILIVICVVGAGFYFFMGRNGAKNASSNLLMVNLQEVTPEAITTKVSADGTVKTAIQKEIKVRLNGLIEEVYVKEGDKVKKEQSLFKLEDQKLEKNLMNAKLALQEAENNYENLLSTYQSQDALNDLELKEAKKNVEIIILSKKKEKINLEKQKHDLQEKLKQEKRNLTNLKEDLADKIHLYENEAIPKIELEMAKEEYNTAYENYRSLKHELKILNEKTIPNALELAELKVDNARNSLNLLKANIKQKRITKNDLEVTQIKVTKAKREIEDIESNLNQVVTKSPIRGTVLEVKVKSGDKVTEGSTIGKIADINNLKAEVMVDEIDVNEVRIGQKVNITSDSFAETINGTVEFVAPISTKVGNINKYRTKIELKNTKGLLRPGMFVNAEIITNQKKDVITVPSMAIMGDEEKFVFVAKKGKAVKKLVNIGLESLSKVEVFGVKSGEKVITGPFTTLKNLKDGTPITGKNIKNNQ